MLLPLLLSTDDCLIPGSTTDKKKAFQSSTFGNFTANLAIDGNNNRKLAGNSCSMTKIQDNPWWAVDFSVKSMASTGPTETSHETNVMRGPWMHWFWFEPGFQESNYTQISRFWHFYWMFCRFRILISNSKGTINLCHDPGRQGRCFSWNPDKGIGWVACLSRPSRNTSNALTSHAMAVGAWKRYIGVP
jgi:hypothetical protein